MKTVARMALLLLPLFAIIAILLVRGPAPDDLEYQRTLGSLHRIAIQQAALDRDMLRARDGLLLDYDPLVSEIAALLAAATAMEQQAIADGGVGPVSCSS